MTRLGFAIGGMFALAGAALLSMTRIGPANPPPVPQALTARPEPAPALFDLRRLSVPVAGVGRDELLDTWGQSRGGGSRTHEAIDIAAPGGTPVVAAAPGVVEKLFVSRAGGNTLYVRSPDRGWSFYYAHLRGYAPGIKEGDRVRQGQLLGYVGDSGNAGAGNNHLHFGIARMGKGERWYGGDPVNPYPLLARSRPPG